MTPPDVATPRLFPLTISEIEKLNAELLLACIDLQETEENVERSNEHNRTILKTARRRVETAIRALRQAGQVAAISTRTPYKDPEEG